MRFSKFNIPFISLLSLAAFFMIEPSLYLVMMLLSVIVHELGHLMAMKIFGVKIAAVTLLPMGIDIKAISMLVSYPKQAVISFSGPLINLIIFFVLHNMKGGYLFFAVFNLLYAFFNLLPIQGLDGGEIVQNILKCFFSQKTTDAVIKIISFIFCILLWFTGVYILLILNGNISIFALSLSLYASIFIKNRI